MRAALPRLLTFLLLLSAADGSAADLVGRASVLDGGRIRLAGKVVRLDGIAAPPRDRLCPQPDGGTWRCGWEAEMAVENELAEHWVTCTGTGRTTDGEILAACRIGPHDVAERLVSQGWAEAVSPAYTAAEAQARARGLGLWRRNR